MHFPGGGIELSHWSQGTQETAPGSPIPVEVDMKLCCSLLELGLPHVESSSVSPLTPPGTWLENH